MIRQSLSKGPAPSLAFAIVNAVVWVIYVALVLLVSQVLGWVAPVAVTVSVLVTAAVLHPLRRRASRAARQRFSHR
jgi:ABC-type bacteriocin/lantibiotic exporter with double-glycine peptidase domain